MTPSRMGKTALLFELKEGIKAVCILHVVGIICLLGQGSAISTVNLYLRGGIGCHSIFLLVLSALSLHPDSHCLVHSKYKD